VSQLLRMTQSFEDCDWLVVQEGKKEQSQVYGLLTYTVSIL